MDGWMEFISISKILQHVCKVLPHKLFHQSKLSKLQK